MLSPARALLLYQIPRLVFIHRGAISLFRMMFCVRCLPFSLGTFLQSQNRTGSFIGESSVRSTVLHLHKKSKCVPAGI